MKSFVYEGMEFSPLKTLSKKDSDFSRLSTKIADIEITPTNWSYEEFYQVAKKNGAGEIDLFEMAGIVVIPGENYLFEYKSK